VDNVATRPERGDVVRELGVIEASTPKLPFDPLYCVRVRTTAAVVVAWVQASEVAGEWLLVRLKE
jgi:hypothetical protein